MKRIAGEKRIGGNPRAVPETVPISLREHGSSKCLGTVYLRSAVRWPRG